MAHKSHRRQLKELSYSAVDLEVLVLVLALVLQAALVSHSQGG